MKHMKLIALLAAAMMVQPALAGSKMDKVKKVLKLAWHSGEVFYGYKFLHRAHVLHDGSYRANGEPTMWQYSGGGLLLGVDGVIGLWKELHIKTLFTIKKK